ncbi:MAG: M14 family zinc carboxypeptidase [Planctomycetaceae bacterium]
MSTLKFRCLTGVWLWSVSLILPATTIDAADVRIRSDFPGGNIEIIRNTGRTVHMAPDLRNDRPWFYWYFEATATTPGRVHFVFPEQVAGFKHGAIGFQGPAISVDRGRSWKWMGTENVRGSSFFHDFTQSQSVVRFAVSIPYVQSDLDRFLEKHARNGHLRRTILTKSRHGRDVELLQIGTTGTHTKPVLVTARHHATETIASYVLEGLLQAAMADTESGIGFRSKYVLFAIPFVDKDGVEEGDQGKNRKPHDHNRDYGKQSLYPEVQAIKSLDQTLDFQFSLDLHCPTLVMKDHQVLYFVGPKSHPAFNFDNVTAFAKLMQKGLPESAPVGPLVWLRDRDTPAPMNSNYFGFKKNAILAATLEVPFAPPGKATSPEDCRGYGAVMLHAWVHTHFLSTDSAR